MRSLALSSLLGLLAFFAQFAAASADAVEPLPPAPPRQDLRSESGLQADQSGLPDFLRGRFECFENGALRGTVDFFRNRRARLSWSGLPHTWSIDDAGKVLIKATENSFFVSLTFDRASKTFHGVRVRSSRDESETRTVLIPAEPAHPAPATADQSTTDSTLLIPAKPVPPAPERAEQTTSDPPELPRRPEKIPLMSEAVCKKLSNKFDKVWEGGCCWLTLKTDAAASTYIPEGANLRRTFQGRLCWAPSAPYQNPTLACLGNDEMLSLSLVNTFSDGSATFLKTGPGSNYYTELAKLKEFIETNPYGTFSIAVQGGAPKAALQGRDPAVAMVDNPALAQARARAALVQVRSDLRAMFPALALKADRVLEPVVDPPAWNPEIPASDPRNAPLQYVRVDVRMEILDRLAASP